MAVPVGKRGKKDQGRWTFFVQYMKLACCFELYSLCTLLKLENKIHILVAKQIQESKKTSKIDSDLIPTLSIASQAYIL